MSRWLGMLGSPRPGRAGWESGGTRTHVREWCRPGEPHVPGPAHDADRSHLRIAPSESGDPPDVVPHRADERGPSAHRRPSGAGVGILRIHRGGPDDRRGVPTRPPSPAPSAAAGPGRVGPRGRLDRRLLDGHAAGRLDPRRPERRLARAARRRLALALPVVGGLRVVGDVRGRPRRGTSLPARRGPSSTSTRPSAHVPATRRPRRSRPTTSARRRSRRAICCAARAGPPTGRSPSGGARWASAPGPTATSS